jgi:Flp pilus assembly protein CpaB
MGTMERTAALARAIRRNRRPLAAMSAGLAILALGLALRPPPPATVDVVVAARDLATGHRLEGGDLGRAAVPTGVALPGATADPGMVVGRVLAAPLVRGEAVVPARLMPAPAWLAAGGAGPASGAGPGAGGSAVVPLPVRFPDADAVRLLTAGQRVDVLAAEGPGEGALAGGPTLPRARVVARGATVLAVADPAGGGTGLLREAAPSEAAGSPLVVLALTEPQALALAGAAASQQLSFTLAPAPPVPPQQGSGQP